MSRGVMLRLDKLKPHPKNYNGHPDNQIEQLRESLRIFGQVRDVIVWRQFIIAGHGVCVAAISLDWKEISATVLPKSWSEEKAFAYLATDNETGRLSVPDDAQLVALLQAVSDEELRKLAAGGEDRLRELMKAEPADAEPQIDRAEELQEKWKVKTGDLWRIGEHRLLCGDSLLIENVRRVLDGGELALIIADPPYGVNIVAADGYVGGGEKYDIPFGGVKNRLGSAHAAKPFGSKADRHGSIGAAHVVDVGKYATVIGDDTTETAIKASTLLLSEYTDAIHVWWGANYYADKLKPSSCWLVWYKETTGNFADCELAWTNQGKAAKLFQHRWNGMLRDSEHERRWHPTQKPAALAAWVFDEFSESGAIILDPFVGAGWSMIGAENSKRRCRAIEIAPQYVAVCLERMATAFPGIEIMKVGESGE